MAKSKHPLGGRKIASSYMKGQTDFQKQQAVRLTPQQKAAKKIEAGAAKMYSNIMFPKNKKK